MGEKNDELLQHYRSMRAELLTALDGLTDARMSEPTLDGWTVKDHLLHVALWDEIRASEVERISAGFDSLWRMDGPHEAAFAPILYELRRDATVAQAKHELRTSFDRLLAAIANAGARGLDASLYGEASLRSGHEAEHTGWIQRWRRERGF